MRLTRRPDDRRFITVTLTDKGRRMIGGIFPRHARHVAREMRALSPVDQAELGRLCRRLGRGRREGREKETDHGVTTNPLRLAPAL
ncbi:MAG TPA: hypothetical protein VL086_20110 [Candidatus Nitrosotalea sp.]|nr:hypothetical protein [Candidatus Nitrosotalea sp.]